MASMCISVVNFATIVTGAGITVGFIGTYILALPELDRDIRRQFYKNALYLRGIYDCRNQVGQWSMGSGFTSENHDICFTLVDYIYQPGVSIREETPVRVESEATRLRFYYSDGNEELVHLENTLPRTALWETLTMVLNRRCRRMGIGVAFVGAVIAVIGAII